MKTEMVSYCFCICVKKLWLIYILQEGSDNMNELCHHGVMEMKWDSPLCWQFFLFAKKTKGIMREIE